MSSCYVSRYFFLLYNLIESQNKIIDLSIEEILKHEAWYKKYTELKIKQKEAIAKWRQNKNSSNKIITQEENKPKTNPQGKKENKVNKQEIQEKIIAWKVRLKNITNLFNYFLILLYILKLGFQLKQQNFFFHFLNHK